MLVVPRTLLLEETAEIIKLQKRLSVLLHCQVLKRSKLKKQLQLQGGYCVLVLFVFSFSFLKFFSLNKEEKSIRLTYLVFRF